MTGDHKTNGPSIKARTIAMLTLAIIPENKCGKERKRMIRKYNVTVDGETYFVEAEEIGGGCSQDQACPAQTYAERSPIHKVPEYPCYVSCFIPGTIVDVYVTPGQNVAEDDVLLILEAMKMENEIVAPQAGVVKAVHVRKGTVTKANEVLVTIEEK